MIMETEAAIMANFDYLSHHGGVEMDDDDMGDDIDDEQPNEDQIDTNTKRKKIKVGIIFVTVSGVPVVL